MWLTLEDGMRRQVRKQDVELLLCANAQESVEGRVYATMKIMTNSKQLIHELSYFIFELPKLIGYDQCIADQKGIGINAEVMKRGSRYEMERKLR